MPNYREYNKRDRKMRSFMRSVKRGITLAVAVLMILGISWVITYVIEAPQKIATAKSISASIAAKQEEENRLNAEKFGPAFGPAKPEEGAPLNVITAKNINLPQNGRVEMSYFADTLFVGDSITQGLNEYASGIKEAKYAAYRGVGPKQLLDGVYKNSDGTQVSYFDDIKNANAGKIYIMLGINSINSGTTDEAFIKYYGDLLDKMMLECAPQTAIYVQSITPVSAQTAQDERYSQTHIDALNEQIAKLAFSRGLNYLDVNAVLKGEDGNLNADYTAPDGLHLNGAGYGVWKEYLITHTKHSKTNPYVMGSPFILAQ